MISALLEALDPLLPPMLLTLEFPLPFFLVPGFDTTAVWCCTPKTDSLPARGMPISHLLPVHSKFSTYQEMSLETKTKEKQRLCSAVSLVLVVFYVHSAASHSCLMPGHSLWESHPHLSSARSGTWNAADC